MQLVYSFVQFFQYGVQMLLVFLVGICVHLDAECITGQGAPKYRGIPCSGADGVIFGKCILFPETRRTPDDFSDFILWGCEHVRSKRICLQQLQGSLCRDLAEHLQVSRKGHFEFRIQLDDDCRLEVFEVIVVADLVSEVNDVIIRDNGSFQGSVQTNFGSLF